MLLPHESHSLLTRTTSRTRLTIISTVLALALVGCNESNLSRNARDDGGQNNSGETENTVIFATVSGRVLTENPGQSEMTPVAGARVVIYTTADSETAVEAQSEADADGLYDLVVDRTQMPDFFLIQVEAEGFLPYEINMANSSLLAENTLDIILVPMDVSLSSVINDNGMHHLGDDRYMGQANSQFQVPTGGLTYQKSFSLSELQLQASAAVLEMMVRGAQTSNPVYINGVRLGDLGVSPLDGSFSLLQLSVPMTILESENTLRIDSALNPSIEIDYDDVEFGSILLDLIP